MHEGGTGVDETGSDSVLSGLEAGGKGSFGPERQLRLLPNRHKRLRQQGGWRKVSDRPRHQGLARTRQVFCLSLQTTRQKLQDSAGNPLFRSDLLVFLSLELLQPRGNCLVRSTSNRIPYLLHLFFGKRNQLVASFPF